MRYIQSIDCYPALLRYGSEALLTDLAQEKQKREQRQVLTHEYQTNFIIVVNKKKISCQLPFIFCGI